MPVGGFWKLTATPRTVRLRCAAVGAAAIVAGLAVYALARPARIPLIPPALHFAAADGHPGAVVGVLPSIVHAFAMPLLTVACLERLRRGQVLVACLAWCVVDLAFEIGQDSGISFLPAGTCDPLDVLAILLGTVLAGVVSSVLLQGSNRRRGVVRMRRAGRDSQPSPNEYVVR